MLAVLSAFETIAAAGPQTDPEGVRDASVLFLALFLLLGAFFLGILLITIGRRRRGERGKAPQRETGVDPWQEAGRRTEVDQQPPAREQDQE